MACSSGRSASSAPSSVGNEAYSASYSHSRVVTLLREEVPELTRSRRDMILAIVWTTITKPPGEHFWLPRHPPRPAFAHSILSRGAYLRSPLPATVSTSAISGSADGAAVSCALNRAAPPNPFRTSEARETVCCAPPDP